MNFESSEANFILEALFGNYKYTILKNRGTADGLWISPPLANCNHDCNDVPHTHTHEQSFNHKVWFVQMFYAASTCRLHKNTIRIFFIKQRKHIIRTHFLPKLTRIPGSMRMSCYVYAYCIIIYINSYWHEISKIRSKTK